MKLNEDEKRVIRMLKNIGTIWPESLWLFSASGRLHVMKKDENNERVYKSHEGVDSAYSVDVIEDIENDGGDW